MGLLYLDTYEGVGTGLLPPVFRPPVICPPVICSPRSFVPRTFAPPPPPARRL